MRRFVLLVFVAGFLAGCASLTSVEVGKLHAGMTVEEVLSAVGRPLMKSRMHIMRAGQEFITETQVWEYRNLWQNQETLLYFFGDELRQIESNYSRGNKWPLPQFDPVSGEKLDKPPAYVN